VEGGWILKAVLIEREDGRPLASQAWCTQGVSERIEGWFSKKSVEPGEGLLIAPCASVHTFGMSFKMDLLFLDGGMRVIKVVTGLKPNRVAWAGVKYFLLPWNCQALELPCGAAAGIKAGESLKLSERAA
jgi:uncharacterized membrane protein (UPF0127 family)